MNQRIVRCLCVLPLVAALSGCGAKTPVTPTPTPTPVVPTPVPVVINAPTPVAPLSGASTNGWPTFTVTNATHTGQTGTLVYRFDISALNDFSVVILSGTVPEGSSQTSFTPPVNQAPPPQTALFWRAVVIDQTNSILSQSSAAQSFKYADTSTVATNIALQEGVALWAGVQPPGLGGHATLGNSWGVTKLTSFGGTIFTSPEIQELQIFDLLDRGLAPQAAIDWMHANGYSTIAGYYPDIAVLGFQFQYMALVNGRWDLVLKSE
jgi:hypothetical protein